MKKKNVELVRNIEKSDILTNTQDVDSNCFLIAKGVNGLDIVCKDIKDFSTMYLTKKHNEPLFKINGDSFISFIILENLYINFTNKTVKIFYIS